MGKKRGQNTGYNAQSILKIFQEAGKPLHRKELFSILGVDKSKRKEVRSILKNLVDQGKLIRFGKSYGLVKKMPMVSGTLEIQRSGVGFVIPEDKRRKDIFISRRNLGEAWNGDRVLSAILPGQRGKNPEGRIVRVVERVQEVIAVKIVRKLREDMYFSHPTDAKLQFNVIVDAKGSSEQPALDDIVLVKPTEELERSVWACELEEILGPEHDVSVQEALVKTNYAIPTEFPETVLRELETLPDTPEEEDFAGREDLRDLPLVTIDGATAKDFDDAVCVRREGDKFRLWVAIADVSHYVAHGTRLDREAQERGNSYYFPTSVEPMFPEKLSNGLCSLVPDQPRLAMVAEMLLSSRGVPLDGKYYPAVIRSHARLTYSQVKRAVLDKDAEAQKPLRDLLPMLYDAETLARLLKARREERGSLDFDLPEPEVLINIRDRTEDIRPKTRNFAHQIIEEFMLAANESVARFLTDKEMSLLYRIHPEPDQEKLDALFELLQNTSLGPELPEDRDIKALQKLLVTAKDTEMEFLVNRLALRSMMQAKYTPVNEGHFGPASDCYCHFTSPIRRYADLVVHRSLKQAMGVTLPGGPGLKRLKETADHINKQERIAMEADREIVKRLTILFLRDKVGQTFTGVIASLADFGFWVELKEVMAEGMVRLSSLTDDYYVYLDKKHELLGERTGRSFRLGQEVNVRLEEVNLSRLEITLSLEE
ncbi:MAG: ribonuclease R [Desulfovibrionales bacterium]